MEKKKEKRNSKSQQGDFRTHEVGTSAKIGTNAKIGTSAKIGTNANFCIVRI